MNNNKKSSVEWLRSLYENRPAYEECILDEEWEQAKAMHKEEIMDAFQLGKWDWVDNVKHGLETKDPAEYYNETFGDKQ